MRLLYYILLFIFSIITDPVLDCSEIIFIYMTGFICIAVALLGNVRMTANDILKNILHVTLNLVYGACALNAYVQEETNEALFRYVFLKTMVFIISGALIELVFIDATNAQEGVNNAEDLLILNNDNAQGNPVDLDNTRRPFNLGNKKLTK